MIYNADSKLDIIQATCNRNIQKEISFMKTLLVPALLTLGLLFGGCAQQQTKTSETAAEAPPEGQEVVTGSDLKLELNGDSDSSMAGALQTVFFDFDSSALRNDTRATLEGNAAFLKDNPSVEVQVEGHCDERGGIQYNLALGLRRAKSVKNYLVALGIESNRVTTISFGKERPIAFGHSEDAWSKNRRGNFVITAK